MVRSGLLHDYAGLFSYFARLVDIAGILFGGVLAYFLRFDGIDYNWPPPENYWFVLLLAMLLGASILPMFGMYQSWRGRTWLQHLGAISLSWMSVVIALIVLGAAFKASAEFSRQWFVLWVALTFILILIFRVLLHQALRLLRLYGRNKKWIVIIGAGNLGQSVAKKIKESPWTGLSVAYFLDDNPALQNSEIDGVPVRGTIDNATLITDGSQQIDEVWIALPLRAETRVKDILRALRHSTRPIRFIPDIFGFRLLNHSVGEVAGIPVLDLNASPMVGMNRFLKAVEDRALALVILTIISPLLVILSIGVKLSSSGPVLFKQKRHGWDGEPINIYKFRTMVIHDEPNNKVSQAHKNDTRITPFGAFLRRTSLDELPQFINVLQGRMSIVGPRPHAIAHNDEYKEQIEAYMQRHRVKPGITGWAQINGFRGETDTLEKMQKRVEYDLFYIDNWSLAFDLKIILLTIFIGFVHENAY